MENNVLQVEPRHELRFRGPFHDSTKATIKLTNLVDERVCFKVKTTAPKQYCVRPTCGELKPRSDVSIQVILQPFQYDPNEHQKHKFLVQSMVVPLTENITNYESLWKTADPSVVMETKLKCVLESGASAPDAPFIAGDIEPQKVYTLESAQSKEDAALIEQLNILREENRNLRKENMTLREAGLRQRHVPAGGSTAAPPPPASQYGQKTDSVHEPFADASIKSIAVMSFILLAVGFLIAKTLF